MSLYEFKCEIPPAEAGAIDELLLNHGDGRWSVVEDVIVQQAWVIGVFEDEAESWHAWEALKGLGVNVKGSPALRPLADQDWRDSYKAHFKAWKFGRLHWVPIWQRDQFAVPAGDAVLWLDPGLAFGTGNHETTRLCVERLVGLAPRLARDARIVDAGCGSGILALSAVLLGFTSVIGFDNDPEAVRVSRENAALNGLQPGPDFFVADLVSGLRERQADLLMANIQSDVLIRFQRELIAAVAPRGTLVLSGILAHEQADVLQAFRAAAPGWAIEGRVLGEWSDVMLSRPAALS
ncbi:50S ribosomal protein L11 methyltransferase [Horticoccus luteus]|uniref:Ribosomal protein L11 methyltransferase n=1 Tax=Horticoccus luteus TaxID=2862869 RepID=A0A8F9XIT8_9BACT|nr:50S ribosomal protein L11 methyltransferase [Horticoccus luteus]